MRRGAGLSSGVASGLLLWAAFPPLSLGPLAFVALVPLALRLRATGGRETTLSFFGFAAAFFTLGLSWLSPVITIVGVILLSLVIWLLFFLPFGAVLGYALRRGGPLLVLLPAGWVASDWCRTWLFTGFPWLFPAHALADWTTLIQVSDVLGAWGVTALVVFVNAALAEAIHAVGTGAPKRGRLPALASAIAFGMFLAYGALRLPSIESRPGPKVLLVQGNVAQGEKQEAWHRKESGPEMARTILAHQLRLTARGVAEHPEAQVVIWSETMFPFRIDDGPDADPARRSRVRGALAAVSGAAGNRPVIVGSLHRTAEGEARNSVFLLGPGGRRLARYDKRHTVPGGEHIPLKTVMPERLTDWIGQTIARFSGYVPDLTEGEAPAVMETAGARFDPLVCYEICYPEIVRSGLDLEPDVLLNLSNYAWYPNTAQQEQAEDITIFRAVENRRTVVVSANSGISSVIDARGVVGARIAKETEGVLSARVPICRNGSLWAVWGDAPAWLAVFVFLAIPLRRRLGKKWRSAKEDEPT